VQRNCIYLETERFALEITLYFFVKNILIAERTFAGMTNLALIWRALRLQMNISN